MFENGKADFENPKKVVFQLTDEKPRFLGCNFGKLDANETKKCSDEKMLMHVYRNVKYPAEARKNGIQGMVVINFVIDKEGNVHSPTVLRDIGGGAGEEGLRVVRNMPQWIPAEFEGQAVNSSFNLPIKFKLE